MTSILLVLAATAAPTTCVNYADAPALNPAQQAQLQKALAVHAAASDPDFRERTQARLVAYLLDRMSPAAREALARFAVDGTAPPDAVAKEVIDTLFRMPRRPVTIGFGMNSVSLSTNDKSRLLKFAESGVAQELATGTALVRLLARSSQTEEVEVGAHAAIAGARGQAVQEQLERFGISGEVTYPTMASRFRPFFADTPNYRRSGDVLASIPSRWRDVDGIVEEQTVVVVWLPAAASVLPATPEPAYEDDLLPREQVEADEERFDMWREQQAAVGDSMLVGGGGGVVRGPGNKRTAAVATEMEGWARSHGTLLDPGGKRSYYAATQDRLRRERVAVDACLGATDRELRLVHDEPGWTFGSVVSWDDHSIYAGPELWCAPPTATELASGTSRIVVADFYTPGQLAWLAPWMMTELQDQRTALLPADVLTLPERADPTRGIRVTLRIDWKKTWSDVLKIPVIDLRAPRLLAPLAEYVLDRAVRSEVTRLGTMQYYTAQPTAITGTIHGSASIGPVPGGVAPAEMVATANAQITRMSEYWLAELSPVTVTQDPFDGGLYLVAKKASINAYEDLTASEELSDARQSVADGDAVSLVEALRDLHPQSNLGRCVADVLDLGTVAL